MSNTADSRSTIPYDGEDVKMLVLLEAHRIMKQAVAELRALKLDDDVIESLLVEIILPGIEPFRKDALS
jgi:hypothetical protein